ncbi:MAG: penicillin-binding protein 1C [Pseudomonadota bacterium]
MSRILKWSGYVLAAGLLLAAIFFILTGDYQEPPFFGKVKDSYKKSEALLLDRYGQVIQEMRIDKRGRRLEWAGLGEISPALIQAVLHVEDRRFYRHHGVDWLALASSFFNTPRSHQMRGASTISMQLAALLDKRLKPKRQRRTLKQKWNQILAARALERTWTKEQILEAYLNLISYRTELQGITAASRGLFDKDPNGLNQPESLILASLISSPNAPIDRIIRRACFFGKSLGEQTGSEAITALATERLRSPYQIKPLVALAPQVARRLLKGSQTPCRSTLDGKLQRFALETLNHYLGLLKEGQVSDGAVLVLDNKSGEVLAYVGNSGLSSSASYIDGLMARRQAGSTLKPFLYSLAIEKGLLTAASLLDDSPLQIPTPTGLYVPQNYDNLFRGPVSVRTALSASINIPAVRTLLLVGLTAFVDRLKHLGLEGLTEEDEYYGYSLALGSADITLLTLTNAYRALANEGRWSEVKFSFDQEVGKPVRIIDKRAAFIISDILSDREARSSTFGLENPLSTRFWTAAKTGTSKDMRDNWCLGYSEKYTVGVWVGNFSGEPMRNVSGVSGAAPIWMEMMNTLHANRPSRPPRLPAGVNQAKVSFHQDLEPSRQEYFLRGSEPVFQVRADTHYQKPRIIYPAHETLISMDPEIPETLQRVPFQFQPETNHYTWVLNHHPMGSSDPFFLWKPERGNYVLSIVDPQNRILDSVEFQVR